MTDPDTSPSGIDAQTFADFYPFYLKEHSNKTSRRLHFLGSTLALLILFLAIAARQPRLLIFALILGYGFAWVGHFFFERNRPATFKRPWFSFRGDWKMYWDILTGKIPF